MFLSAPPSQICLGGYIVVARYKLLVYQKNRFDVIKILGGANQYNLGKHYQKTGSIIEKGRRL